MNKYIYFVSYIEAEGTKTNYGNREIICFEKIDNWERLDEIADLIKETQGFKNRPVIMNFILLRVEEG